MLGRFLSRNALFFAQNETRVPSFSGDLDCLCRNAEGQVIVLVQYKYLTWCFMNRYLIMVPQMIFCCFLLRRALILRSRALTYSKSSWDVLLKNFCSVAQIFLLAITGRQSIVAKMFDLDYATASFSLFAMIFVAIVQSLEIHTVVIPSDVVLWYWFVTLFTSGIKLLHLFSRSYFQSHYSIAILETFLIGNGSAIFLLEWIIPKYKRARDVKSSLAEADAFSKACVTWINPLLTAATKREITLDDLPSMTPDFHTRYLSDEFYKRWDALDGERGGWSFAWIIFCMSFFRLMSIMVAQVAENILSLFSPLLLSMLIRFVSQQGGNDAPPTIYGVYISLMIFGVQITRTFLSNISQVNEMNVVMGIKGMCFGVLYRKALKFSPQSIEMFSPSQIMNILSVDVNFLMEVLLRVLAFFIAPFQLLFCLITLYKFVGNAVWAALIITILLLPITSYVSMLFSKLYRAEMHAKDKRVKLTSSILTNIKSLKLYAWEKPYMSRLDEARNVTELGIRKEYLMAWAKYGHTWLMIPYSVATGVFIVYLKIMDTPLTAEIVFPCLALFYSLEGPLSALPNSFMAIVQSKVSFDRIASVLSATEKDFSRIERLSHASSYSESSVVVDCKSVTWTENKSSTLALRDIHYSTKKGELSCIVGKVGSGKTAFLLTICGLTCLSKDSSVSVRGKLAYVPQEPWLLNQSVKKNILFGHRYDPTYYQQTLYACCLLSDIEKLADGDETEIGEKGVTLSGGQKARVSLARAVYARADVYVMDDLLSAVDEHVAKHLVENVLGSQGLLKSKSRILATNNIKVLSISNNIYMIENKTFVEHGNTHAVTQRDGKISALIAEFGEKSPSSLTNTDIISEEMSPDAEHFSVHHRESMMTLRRSSLLSTSTHDEHEDRSETVLKRSAQMQESMASGNVKKSLYVRYMKRGGFLVTTTAVSFVFAFNGIQLLSKVWLTYMSEQEITGDSWRSSAFLWVYFLIGLAASLSYVFGFALTDMTLAMRAAKKIHNEMMTSVLRAPMAFFDSNPMGRILNRFTNDISELDFSVPDTVFQFFMQVGRVSSSFLIIVGGSPIVLFSIGPLLLLYFYYQKYYLPCTRQMKRISSASNSPLFSHIEESLIGTAVISAFQRSQIFIKANDMHADVNLATVFLARTIDRWLSMRLSFIGNTLALLSALSGVFLSVKGQMNGAVVGLVMANALEVSGLLSSIMQILVRVELRGIALERLFEYSNLASEAPEIIENKRPPAAWPTEGAIRFIDYSARYRDNFDLVLKGINLDIKPREKIGIVGRTGAGKSSLTLSLFRIIEAASGNIDIDSISSSDIGLQDLRRNLSIIPQDAQIFAGSIRDNLDPYGEHDDVRLWQVLEVCHLKEHVQAMSDGLDASLSEGGGNLSRGQAQLVCLGRALLHPSNILVLDEATASVDVKTDAIIQQTIRAEFKNKTIITIAHRLNTIMDSDKIVVLDFGKVIEFDTPANLLKDKNSSFYALCNQAGLANN